MVETNQRMIVPPPSAKYPRGASIPGESYGAAQIAHHHRGAGAQFDFHRRRPAKRHGGLLRPAVKPPPQLGEYGGGKSTGYGARVARDEGRCRSQWPAGEIETYRLARDKTKF